jgi:hemerythrin
MTGEQDARRAPHVVEWQDAFKVNIPQVDEEHRRLFSLIKVLNLDTVERTVEELLEYVFTHFSNEQALMEKSSYPAFEQHLRLHEEFGAHVAGYIGSGEPWNEERVHEIRRFLNKWLIGHIMADDLRFGRWYAENNMGQSAPVDEATEEQRGFLARLFGRK